jgi:predicted phage terminase large subunit-like protein
MIQLYDDLDALPLTLRIYGASDYATMEPQAGKKEPDFTEHGVWGMDKSGDLWAVDWWYRQVETDKGIAAFLNLVNQHKPLRWFNEGGLIDKAIGPTIRKEMRNAYASGGRLVAIESLPSLQDKAIKLQAFHSMCTAGMIHVPDPRKCRWSEHVIEQLLKFPGGRWDDAADVCGLIGRGVDQMANSMPPVAEERPQLIPFTEAWLTYNDKPDKPKVRYTSNG